MFKGKSFHFILYVLFSSIVLSSCSGEINENLDSYPVPLREVVESEPKEIVNEQGKSYHGKLELPINGATGFAPIRLELKQERDSSSGTNATMKAGAAFRIIEEREGWWFIEWQSHVGWIEHRYCFINLPDVIPSIIYNNTNTYDSRFQSSGVDIPNITGKALYSGKAFNERLQRNEYIMAVLYSMSTKIYNAQQQALVEGNSLILYEGFRPHHVQVTVAKELSSLAEQDAKVMNGINTPPWGIGWFIVNGSSNHQVGYAIDVGLAKVEEKTSRSIGGFSITDITAYSEYIMPTSIHELSGKSSIFKVPVSSKNDLDWRTTQYNSDMTIGALLLHRYATESGLTPLASEWWHFNDLDARDEMEGIEAAGKFTLSEIESKIPQP